MIQELVFVCECVCLEKEMATHSSILAWKIPWTEEPGNVCVYCCCLVAKLCLTRLWFLDCSPWGSFAHGISQARIPEQVAISFSRGSSWLRDQSCVSYVGRWVLYHWATREARVWVYICVLCVCVFTEMWWNIKSSGVWWVCGIGEFFVLIWNFSVNLTFFWSISFF